MESIEDLTGSVVIVRSRDAGVHAGTLRSVDGDTVVLSGARRLWRWWAASSLSLSGVARHGLAQKPEVRVAGKLPVAVVRGWCEILPTTATAAISIAQAPEAPAEE